MANNLEIVECATSNYSKTYSSTRGYSNISNFL